MKAKKVLKIVGIILLVLIVLLMIHTIRNYIIVSNLQNKISEYSESTNYHTRIVTTESSGSIVTIEYYQKDDKQACFMTRDMDGEITKISMYNNGERVDTFVEGTDGKTAEIGNGIEMSVYIYNTLETENNWETFFASISSSIKSTTYNGKECYVVSYFTSSMTLTEEGQEVYIEKDTGLLMKTVTNSIISEREYEFDNVDDSIFVEPNIGEYTIVEDS